MRLGHIAGSGRRFLSDEGPMLETSDRAIRIGSAPTFLYFDLEPSRTGLECNSSLGTDHYIFEGAVGQFVWA